MLCILFCLGRIPPLYKSNRMDEQSWKVQVQSYISQASDSDAISQSLTALTHLLSTNHSKQCSLTEFCEEFAIVRKYFLSGPYEELLYIMLDVLSNTEVVSANHKLISCLFMEGLVDVSYEVSAILWHKFE